MRVCGREAYPKGAEPHTLKMRLPPDFLDRQFVWEPRGKIIVTGKGEMECWQVKGAMEKP
jgi:hypothetical protein